MVLGYLMQNLRLRGRRPLIIIARIVRPLMTYNFAPTVFTQRNFVADFVQAKCDFKPKTAVLRFDPLFGQGLGATCGDHLRLIEKRIVDFLLVLSELFSLGITAEALQAKIDRTSAISLERGPFDSKFQIEGVAPSNQIVRTINALQHCC